MTHRTDRAKFLGEQLSEAMHRLGQVTLSADILLFLDRLARLETFPQDDLDETEGLVDLVRRAQAARQQGASEIAAVASRGLDLEQFLDTGRRLRASADTGERDGWLRDLLLVATVLPWLSAPRAWLARAVIEKAEALVESDPEGFLAASRLAEDRLANEYCEGLSTEARGVISLLQELPLLVLFDRQAGEADASRVEAALRAAGEDAVEAAEDAVLDCEGRSAFRLPSSGNELRLAAQSDVGIALCRMEAGVWVVALRAGQAFLRWSPASGEEDVGVEILQGEGALTRDPDGGFALPSTDAALVLRLRVGPDSRVVRLDPEDR
jgi:hypothetical protein